MVLLAWRSAAAQENAVYPDAAYSYDAGAPMPGESPLGYFGRQLNLSRGPYGTAHDGGTASGEFDAAMSAPETGMADGSSESFASYSMSPDPSELSESYTEDYDTYMGAGECESGPTSQKNGLFQKWTSRVTYIPSNDGDPSLGITSLETWVVLGLPCPTRENPLLITPGFGAHLLDSSGLPDVPDTLYDAYVQFRWLGKLNGCWGYDLVVTPGYYSDFEDVDGDAFRPTGRAIVSYEWSPTIQLLFGAVYLNREDLQVLPAAGAIYQPSDDVRWEFVMPRPRYARRISQTCDCEKWWYVVGEFGGGSWQVTRDSGAQDVLTLNDYRCMLGYETKLNGGAGYLFEVGYVFGRELEYSSAPIVYDLDSSFVARAAITF
jgi:hypothetical protein